MVAEQAEALFSPTEFSLHGRAEVLLGMLRKDELLKQGRVEEARKMNIVVYFDGGGQAVANEAGWGQLFYDLGWFGKAGEEPVINTVIGASGGSVVAAYTAIGAKNATDILRMNCQNQFVGWDNVRRSGRPVDFEGFGRTLHQFDLKPEALKGVGARIVVLASNDKLERVAFDLKEAEDPIRILQRSCLIPLVGNISHIDGHTDGALGGIALDIIDSYHPTNVLVVSCFPFGQSKMQRRVDDMLDSFAQRIPHPVLRHVLSANRRGRDATQEMFLRHFDEDLEHPVHYAIVAPTRENIGMFEMSWAKLQQAIAGSRLAAERMFKNIPVVYAQLGM